MRTLLILLFSTLLLVPSCSLLLNRQEPRYTENRVPRVLLSGSCRQSNWPAGVDLIFAGTAGISALIFSDEGEPAGTIASLAMLGAVGYSMVYGFSESSRCRGAHASAGYPVHGANDWLIPPLLLIGVGAVMAAQPRGGAAPAPVGDDSCEPGEPITAQCSDGTWSCSHHRRGTCAYHGGVQTWHRVVAP
jgi:hypothetical protein